ncbi:MAG: hypothetical protein KTQ12_09155, partial [Dermatophilaceae bacterium]|nr:hypothetical protein [Dermatophilaceae bacterium]
MPDNDRTSARLPAAVLAHLTEVLGATPQTTGKTEAELPGGERLVAYHAVSAEKPNAVVAVVAAADGTITPRADFTAALGHDPFIPHFDPPVLGTVPPRRRPVTINPRRNDWRLDQCDRRSEKITVTIPPTGTAPKADVYLLADTTGSMAPVIDAVKAGADAILSDPA